MIARRFGLRTVLLGLIVATVTGLVTTAGTAAAEQAAPGCSGTSGAFAKRLPQVRPGQSGTYVMGLQRALANEGYDLVGTGWYGPKTLAAVRDFQARHGIRNSGIVGILTWHALVGKKRACGTLNGRGPIPSFGLLPGDRDLDRWVALQDRILRVWNNRNLPNTEHFYGPGWQAVVKDFQRANGIKPSGIVGPKTWRALNLVISISGVWSCGC